MTRSHLPKTQHQCPHGKDVVVHPNFFSSHNAVRAGDKLNGGVRTCVFTFTSSQKHSVRCQSMRSDII